MIGNVRLDMDRAMDLLMWYTRRCIFHEIAASEGKTYSAVGACLAISSRDDYLLKEAVTRIRRVCVLPGYWYEDWQGAGE
jgi:hypothetical protein